MVEVDPADPAFDDPTKFVGPVYDEDEADALAAEKGWAFKPDGDSWRRVVPSPEPKRIFEIRPIRWLLEHDVRASSAPAAAACRRCSCPARETHARRRRGGHRQGPRQRAAGPRGRRGPVRDGHRRRRACTRTGARRSSARSAGDAGELRGDDVPGRVDGPKVEAACRFVEATGGRAAIGALTEIEQIVDGTAGTQRRDRADTDGGVMATSASTPRWARCAR